MKNKNYMMRICHKSGGWEHFTVRASSPADAIKVAKREYASEFQRGGQYNGKSISVVKRITNKQNGVCM